LIKGLDVILLGLLTARPRTGYDIRKWLDRYGNYFGYSAPTSQIYRQMARLVERDWAYSVVDPRSSGPDAKLYTVTDEGRAAFEDWVSSPYVPAERPMDPYFQMRLLFSQHRGPETILALVRTELAYRRAQHEHPLSDYSESLLPEDAGPAERAWAQEMYLIQNQRGRFIASTLITWLETTEARLAVLVESAAQQPAGSRGPRPSDEAIP
jgi:DNA-binding PadR family transcriptional regulator